MKPEVAPVIEFNPDLFNNVYFHIEEALANDAIRFLYLYGGSSASKTFSMVQETVKWMLTGEDNNSLVLRKFATDIRDSIFSDFKTVIADWGLQDLFIVQQNFIKCVSGSYVRFRGLDDSEKVKGISNFKRIILEEISQFDETDLKQIRKRLRGQTGQKIIGIFNPVSEEHWLKTKVFDLEELIEVPSNITGKWVNKKGNTVILKVTYLDNIFICGKWHVNAEGKLVQVGGFVDQHTIDDFEADKVRDFDYYNIYALGNWGKLRTGGEFWKDINANEHFVKAERLVWDDETSLHITWDENVNPYLTMLVWQIVKVKEGDEVVQEVRQIDEFCYEDPRNKVRHICADFKKKYPKARVPKLFIYGDRTSIKESTTKEKGENFFTEIKAQLKEYEPILRMQSVNPSVIKSGQFVNELYAGKNPLLRIRVSLACKKSVYDYRYALEDSEGALSKKKKAHPVTKIMFEEFGHCSDAKRYFITVAFASEYQKFLQGGKRVGPRTGKSVAKHGY